jgi:hypothetical protein
MKKFIISESEKNNIRRMYGLIVEQNTNLPSLPYPVTGSWTAPDCDALHAFQSRQEDKKENGKTVYGKDGKPEKISVYFGDMNAKVCEALAIFWGKIPVKVTNLTVTVNGMNVSYDVTIDKSNDNVGMNGFTSRGAGCGKEAEIPTEFIKKGYTIEKYLEYRATNETGKSENEIKDAIKQLNGVGKLNYFEKVNSFYDPKIPDGKKIYQVFYQYQTENPPQIKSQETIKKEQNVNTQQPNQQKPVIITKQKPNEKKTQQTTVNNNQQSKSTNGKTSVEEDKEITDYLDYYLKNKTCDEIAKDLEKFKSSAAYKNLSKDEKDELDNGIMGLENPRFAIIVKKLPCKDGANKSERCDCVKNYMKEELIKKLKTDRDKVITQACELVKTYPPQKPLTVCSPKINTGNNTNTNTGTNTTINTGNNTNTGTNTKTDEPEVINTKPKTNEPVIINSKSKKNEPVIINSKSKTNEPVIINSKSKTNTSTPTTSETNYTLDTPQKIQEFQIWMDDNYGKWAYSRKYNKNYKVNRNPKLGFGRLGPNTNKYWNTDSYRNDYLKEKGLIQ